MYFLPAIISVLTTTTDEKGACKDGGKKAGVEVGGHVFYQGHVASSFRLEHAHFLPDKLKIKDQQLLERRLWVSYTSRPPNPHLTIYI